jgi:transcriptional regulator with XRE-family HTH domain
MDFSALGQFLKNSRQAKGITQQRMAQDLAISRSTINAFEQGRAGDVGLRKVLKMFDYLGLMLQPMPQSPFPTFEQLRATADDR